MDYEIFEYMHAEEWFMAIFFCVIFGGAGIYFFKFFKGKFDKRKHILNNYGGDVQKYIDILKSNSELMSERKKCELINLFLNLILLLGVILYFFNKQLSGLVILIRIAFWGVKNKKYYDIFKDCIIEDAIKAYDSELRYNKTGGFPRDLYDEGSFEIYNEYKSEDQMMGFVNDCEFMIADVRTRLVTEDHKGNRNYTNKFKGQIAMLYLSDFIDLDMTIGDNRLKLLGDDCRIEVDNQAFEQYFDVVTNNKINAMKALTPAVTNKILDLRIKYDLKFEIKLVSNKLYFRVYGGNLFEPEPLNIKVEAMGIALYFEIISCIKDIMKEMIEALKKV